ncbi:MAG: hypothetical protein D6757_02000, partial [Alphaproteobacteria bacterium]
RQGARNLRSASIPGGGEGAIEDRYAELREWYAELQRGTADEAVMARAARNICNRMSREELDGFVRVDPLQGRFVVDLVRTWAEQDPEETEDVPAVLETEIRATESDDDNALRAAIKALKSQGDEGWQGATGMQAGAEEEEVDLEEEDVEIIAMEMHGLLTGEDPAATETDSISEEVQDGPGDGAAAGGTVGDNGEAVFADGAGDETEDVNVPERVEELAMIVGDMRRFMALKAMVRDGAAEWDTDLAGEEDRRVHVQSLASQLDAMLVHFNDVREECEPYRHLLEDMDWLLENEWIIEEGFAKRALDGAGGEADAAPEEEEVPQQDQGDRFDVTETDAEEEVDEEEGHAENPTLDEEDEEGETPAESEGVETDVTMPELSEIERAGSLVTKWGKVCRKAGATDASVGKAVLERQEDALRINGVCHLVFVWKTDGEDRRLNVFLKFLPEGEWKIENEGDLVARSADNRVVRVRRQLLESAEVRGSRNIVHFFGDGVVTTPLPMTDGNLVLVDEMTAPEEVREFMKA